MRSHYLAMGLAISAVALAACSSGGSTSPPASSPTAAPSTPPPPVSSTPVAAAGQITANWETFFSGKTAAPTKISVLQNGQAFASVIDGQANSAISKSASAKVSSVSVNSTGSQATVKYTVYFGSTPALANQTGVAFNESGTWKVADSTFCALLALENNGKAPSVCSSAG
jgi:glucose/arabinose dehydrogenase